MGQMINTDKKTNESADDICNVFSAETEYDLSGFCWGRNKFNV